MNPRLKQLMKDLGEAINVSLSESEQIAQVIARIKDEGFDVFLVLEATIGFSKTGNKEGEVATFDVRVEPPPVALKMTPLDKKFLRSLKITVEEDEP